MTEFARKGRTWDFWPEDGGPGLYTREPQKRLYRRLCLTCGFVITGLYERRPFPIVRRCKLCAPLASPSRTERS
jgi:hypothetical protein